MSLPKQSVAVIAPVTGQHGQGEYARALLTDLERVPGLQIEVLDVDIHALARCPPTWAARATKLAGTLVVLMNPGQLVELARWLGRDFFGNRHVIGLWWWETERAPRSWIRASGFLHELWVGSPYVAACLRQLPVPIRVVPLPRTLLEPLVAPSPGPGCHFLVVFDVRSSIERKNPQGAIDAYLRAFPQPRPGVGLTIKAHGGSVPLRLPPDRTDIEVQLQHLDRDGVLSLIASHHVLVSLHRAEGLGLVLLEAMRMGRPVLATAYSGNLCYMDSRGAGLVACRPVPLPLGKQVYAGAGTWAEPDVGQAAARMRQWADNRTLARQVGAEQQRQLQRLSDDGAAFLQQALAPNRTWPARRFGQTRGLIARLLVRQSIENLTAWQGRVLARVPWLHAVAKKLYAKL